jgi:protein-L-isoaspartate(D-aspartate) O-methyltransferase
MNNRTRSDGEQSSARRWAAPLAVALLVTLLGLGALLTSDGGPVFTQPAATGPATSLATRPMHFPQTRPGAEERAQERERMVRVLLAYRWPQVTDQRVIAAMRAVPRHKFVPPEVRRAAYDDTPLPIGLAQTISQPYIVALMSQLLQTKPGDRVLEVGTGSGYQAAVLADMGCTVYTVEILKELGSAAKRLAEMHYDAVHAKVADGYFGWKEHAPYDAIVVTCAATDVPPPLIEQVKTGGRICIPVKFFDTQDLVLATKQPDGRVVSRSVTGVQFVPLLGGHDRRPRD